jgi:NADP-dependent 3-hydroxy acid dehydrogenase YdfG
MKGKAVVTGASSGIGAATARALSKDFIVYCAARRVDRIEALAAEIGGVAVQCDVTVPHDVARLATVVGADLDVLVNNAGGALGQDWLEKTPLDDWGRMYEINVLGAARVTQALLPALRA